MKRLILSAILMISFATPTLAYCNYPAYCAPVPYSLANTSDIMGSTELVEKFAQSMIKNVIRMYTNQDSFVEVKLFNLQELLNGKFKSLLVMVNNIEIGGIHLSAARVQTLCEFNHIDIKSRPARMVENSVVAVAAEASASDLRNTIEYKNFSDKFSRLNLSELGIASFRVYSQTIDVRDGKLYFTINAKQIGSTQPIDIAVRADIKAQGGRIITAQVDFINLNTSFDLLRSTSLLNGINDLNFPVTSKNKKIAEVQVQSLNLSGDKIYINGIILLPKTM